MVGLRNQRAQHAALLQRYATALESPDDGLNLAFEWAKLRCDSFLADTPGIGRSLLAGYAPTSPGWGDGRPGYAWYFGRDACWTALAQLAAGDRESPRDVLKFLAQTQDVTGKVIHEYTTSGLAHYDAADSTPLFLLLAGRFAAWTGDLDYLKRHWEAIERAYRFCLETDRDGDGLIENTRVGHGWIEHGPLGGAHVSLYLAACWIAALEALEPVAEALGRSDLGAEMRTRRGHGPRHGRSDASAAAETTRSASWPTGRSRCIGPPCSPCPCCWGGGSRGHGRLAGYAVAGPEFSAPCGVRMLATGDPLFEAKGYHRGAVWPLYTGWVSLAEWKAARYRGGAGAPQRQRRARGGARQRRV